MLGDRQVYSFTPHILIENNLIIIHLTLYTMHSTCNFLIGLSVCVFSVEKAPSQHIMRLRHQTLDMTVIAARCTTFIVGIHLLKTL